MCVNNYNTKYNVDCVLKWPILHNSFTFGTKNILNIPHTHTCI